MRPVQGSIGPNPCQTRAHESRNTVPSDVRRGTPRRGVGPGAREPDRRAHRLQRRSGAPGGARRAHHGRGGGPPPPPGCGPCGPWWVAGRTPPPRAPGPPGGGRIPSRGRLLLVDAGGRHELAAGALNRRRGECEAAVARLQLELPELTWLAAWPAAWLARLKRALPEPLRARAVHVVGETARTRFGAQLLARGRLKQFGRLLYESHESCRRLYECSAPELDLVVAAAKRAGALGARLTGAGWGGAVLVLVERKREARITAGIRGAFARAYGREPPISVVRAAGGGRRGGRAR